MVTVTYAPIAVFAKVTMTATDLRKKKPCASDEYTLEITQPALSALRPENRDAFMQVLDVQLADLCTAVRTFIESQAPRA